MMTWILSLILGLLSLSVHFYFKSTKPNGQQCRSTSVRAPEPPGALPFIGHLHLLGAQTPLPRTLGALADSHGPIFSLRLGSHRALVVSGWEFVKECFTTNDMVFASRPNIAFSKYIGYDQAVFALAPYGLYWREVRKIVTLELFTSQKLEKLKHIRELEAELCIKDLHLQCVKNRDLPTKVTINKWFEHLTFNIIVKMLAGKRFSDRICTNSGTGEDAFEGAIKKALYLSGIFVVSDVIPCLEWLDLGGHLKAMKQTAKEIDTVLGRWLQEHIQKRSMEGFGDHNNTIKGEPDFIDVMLSVLAEDVVMSGHKRDTIIKATIMILVLTGSESTAETLTWALSLLLNNRHALKTAQDELDAQVGRDKLVQESDIKNLQYLQAIVKETLRLYPPGPLAGPHEATEDCQVGGYYVKKGTRLIVNLWKLQRDPRIWSSPEEFKPERFLTEHVDVGFRGQQFEYIPFSSGRRMCPGVTFGLQVVHLALARLIQGFDMTTPMGAPVDMAEGLGIALPKIHPLEVVIKPRLRADVY